jgi:hypothetical protein
MAPGGAASWLYVLHGSKVLLLLPPTQRNRRLFLTWSAVTRATQAKENLVAECFLADYAEGAVKIEVRCFVFALLWLCAQHGLLCTAGCVLLCCVRLCCSVLCAAVRCCSLMAAECSWQTMRRAQSR